MKKYIIFTYISWLASLHIIKLIGIADTYPLNITFPLVFKFITISETWFWTLALSIAGLLVLSLKTNHTTNKIKNTIQIDKKAIKSLENTLKTSKTPIVGEVDE